MNEQATNQQPTGSQGQQTCLCQQVLNQLRECLGISPAVREHLANSRLEFLKAVRAVIDDRIERVAATASQRGTKVPVE